MNDAETNASVLPAASNIGDFERFSAAILARLYEFFPVPCDLAPSELDPQASLELQRIYAGTIEFLEAEGYLRYGEVIKNSAHGFSYGILYNDAVLSAKGLAALSTGQAGATEEAQTVTKGKRLTDAMRSGAIDIAKTIVRELFNEGVKHILG